jgi:hypothetical protein
MKIPTKEQVKSLSSTALKWIAYLTAFLFWLSKLIEFAASNWPF